MAFPFRPRRAARTDGEAGGPYPDEGAHDDVRLRHR